MLLFRRLVTQSALYGYQYHQVLRQSSVLSLLRPKPCPNSACLWVQEDYPTGQTSLSLFINPDSYVSGDFTTRLWKSTVCTFVYYVCGHCFLLTQKSPLQQTFTLLFVIWIFLYQLFVMTCILRIQEKNTYITQTFTR